MQHLHVSAVLHILDDFLFIAPSTVKCSEDLHNFLDMCNFLGIPIALLSLLIFTVLNRFTYF